jgi:hypothetical protein
MNWTLIFEIVGSVVLGTLGVIVVIGLIRAIAALMGVLAEEWADRKKRKLR